MTVPRQSPRPLRTLVLGWGCSPGAATPLRRIAGVPGTRRFVIEIEQGWDLIGAPTNLWLYELP